MLSVITVMEQRVGGLWQVAPHWPARSMQRCAARSRKDILRNAICAAMSRSRSANANIHSHQATAAWVMKLLDCLVRLASSLITLVRRREIAIWLVPSFAAISTCVD